MKEYPSIPTLPTQGSSSFAHWKKRNHNMSEIYAFDKIDGSNVKAGWSSKEGFYKFGSRTSLLTSLLESCQSTTDLTQENCLTSYLKSDQLILDKAEILIKTQEDIIGSICSKNMWDNIILFYEVANSKSFLGNHNDDDPYNVYLIDVYLVDVKRILPPKDFVEIFSEEVNCAALLHKGNCNSDFVQSVQNGTLPDMGSEGVVCKAKGKGNQIIMFKIKRDDWYSKLKQHCGDNWKLFNALK